MSIAFKGRLWMMGGYDLGRLPGATAGNQVWSSVDGKNWVLEGTAPWSGRAGASLVEFNGKLWVIGGTERYFDGDARHLKNDVWSSEDGKNWTQVTAMAAWPARAFHNALAFGGRIYIFGGGNYGPEFQQRNDVWSSADGVRWRRETSGADWMPRIWGSAVVYRGRMWLLGGHSRGNAADPLTGFNLNDVWTSIDGARWTRAQSPLTWGPRHEMSAWVANDSIFVAAGYDGISLKSGVWALRLP